MELYSRKINIWLPQRLVLIVLLHCKKAKEKWHGTFSFNSYSTEFFCECFGQEENVGTLFNDLKFSSFNLLTSLSTLENAALLLSWLPVYATSPHQGLPGELTELESVYFRQGGCARNCRLPSQYPFSSSPSLTETWFCWEQQCTQLKNIFQFPLSIGVTK